MRELPGASYKGTNFIHESTVFSSVIMIDFLDEIILVWILREAVCIIETAMIL